MLNGSAFKSYGTSTMDVTINPNNTYDYSKGTA